MEKEYRGIVMLFGMVAAVVLIGFYPTYFILFPQFEGLVGLHHLHGLAMILWLMVLIIQPVFIKRRKLQWHRLIGKFSYFLVPIIVILMMLVYRRAVSNSLADNGFDHILTLSLLFMPLTDILPFSAFYLLAILYRKRTSTHLRYMIATAVVVVGSGLVRILSVWFGMEFLMAIYVNALLLAMVFLGLILYDYGHKKLSTNKSFIVAFLVFTIPNLLMVFVPKLEFWQTFAMVILK